MKKILVITSLSWVAFFSALPGAAAVFNVPDGNVGALVGVMAAAKINGEADVINLASGGTYTLTFVNNTFGGAANGLPAVDGDGFPLTINGSGATIRRDASAPPMRFFWVSRDNTLTINNLRLENGLLGDRGGAIYSLGDLTLTGCTLAMNRASSSNGGAVSSLLGALRVNDSHFFENAARQGGAIHKSDGIFTVNSSSFVGNSSSVTSGSGGGAILSRGNTLLEVTDSSFVGNQATAGAGAIGAARVIVQGSDLRENMADIAGAIGAIRATVRDSLLRANRSTSGGGGIVVEGTLASLTGELIVEDSSLLGNRSTAGGGGGITVQGASTLEIIGSTLSGNVAALQGGGVVLGSGGVSATIDQSTLTLNDGSAGDGLFANSDVTVLLRNSIVAGNADTNIDGGFTLAPASSNNLTSGDPGLGPLQNNGGTLDTHALLPSSSAIDVGDNAVAPGTTDQRGFPRISAGTVDIGAVEFQQPLQLELTGGSGQSTLLFTPFADPLVVQAREGNGTPIAGATITLSPPAVGPSALFSGGLTPTTDVAGNVSVPAEANGQVGSYLVGAALLGGLSASVDFDLTNLGSDLSLSLSDGVATAVPGQNVVYTLVASNPGPGYIAVATVTDSFPSALNCSWTSSASGGASGSSNGTGNLSDNLSLPAGSSVAYTISCAIDSAATGSLVNTATVDAYGGDLNLANNSATDTNTLAPQADLSISKTDGVTTALPGQSVTYTIVATNNGPSDDPNVAVADAFPADLGCTWTSVAAGGAAGNAAAGSGDLAETLSLPAGSSVSYTASCSIDSAAGGTLSNTATIVGSVADLVSGNNNATDADTALTPEADLAISKTDGVTNAVPGQSVSYSIVATNNGPSDDPNVGVTDTFPADLGCTWTSVAAGGATGNAAAGSGDLAETLSLPAGSSVSYTASCSIDSAAAGTLSNTATMVGSVTDLVSGNNNATDADTALTPEADLAISKTDGVTNAVPGQSVSYSIVATNNGPSDDPNVGVTDTFPADLGCTWTSVAAGGATGNTAAGSGDLADTLSLPVGSSVSYSASCSIDPAAAGTLSNTATIVASVADPTPGNDSATDADTVLTPSADLSITKDDGVTSAVPGESTLTYVIVAGNTGPSDDPAVTVIDTFPGVLTCSWTSAAAGGATGNTSGTGILGDTLAMPAGSTVTYTATCSVDPGATGTLSNTATIVASVVDPTPGNDSATDSDTVLTPNVDLSISKDDGVTSAVPGQVLTYTIEVTQAGPSDAPSSVVTDGFPAGLSSISWTCAASAGSVCTAAGTGDISDTVNLPAGGAITYTAQAVVDGSFVGQLDNTASVSAASGIVDSDPTNNSDGDSTAVTSVADLVAFKEVSGDYLQGGEVTYTVTLVNSSTSAQLDNSGDEFVDILPPELTLLSAVASSGTVGLDTSLNSVTWNGVVPGSGTVEVFIEARISQGLAGTTISNQGQIHFDGDGDGTNELTLATDDPRTAGAGDPTNFRILTPMEVPSLGLRGMLLLALSLGWIGVWVLRIS